MKKKFLFFIAILLVLASCSKSDNTKVVKAEKNGTEIVTPSVDINAIQDAMAQGGFDISNKTLPSIDFELKNLNGESEKLSDYKGKVVFLNFWATWCGPCQSEMPAMEKVYNELKDKDFVILAVDLSEDKDTVRAFIEERNLTFPVLLDKDGQVGAMYDARSIPATYVISRDGNILGRAVGVRPWEDDSFMSIFRMILGH